ncbi:hypothetical protein SAMN02745673_00391 [Marinactinospora thermotolerans DSM 45154]|uniref:Uncharacterized protein n=1 Tax=Marinactinospora thermotolerans DSM 45154 TaxID=1122192 RepID=A0A1T4KI23_9ACTN|nr:hypothetical protein SAMN02745673_00391 [Marinactinospora thermotolerans DSM 45154]
MRLSGWRDEDRIERFLADLGKGPTAMLFRCVVCGTHLAYADSS